MTRRLVLLIGILLVTVALPTIWTSVSSALVSSAQGDAKQQGIWDSSPAPEWNQDDWAYIGTGGCESCHSKGAEYNWRGVEPSATMDEYKQWIEQDKHSVAWKKIVPEQNERARAMGEILLASNELTKPPHEDPQCLSCHSMDWVPDDRGGDEVALEEGVTCDGCHGPSLGWETPHRRSKQWREKSAAEKRELGMFDIFDPVERARMCATCHIGNASEGKILKHSFYAAGHPPLPGIELDTFCEEMPAHWQKDTWQKQYQADGEMRRVQLIFAGAVASLGAYMNYMAESTQTQHWPDFTFFDCYSCHHDLRQDSWRRKRGYEGGTPGRLQPRPWITPLTRASVKILGKPERVAELDKLWKDVRAALDTRAFGDPAAVQAAASALATWSRTTAREIEQLKFDLDRSRAALQTLVGLDNLESADFDSARQVAWAITSICAQLTDPAVGWKPNDAEEVDDILRDLRRDLRLKLPSGTGTGEDESKDIIANLPKVLDAITRYEEKDDKDKVFGSERFKATIGRLAEALK